MEDGTPALKYANRFALIVLGVGAGIGVCMNQVDVISLIKRKYNVDITQVSSTETEKRAIFKTTLLQSSKTGEEVLKLMKEKQILDDRKISSLKVPPQISNFFSISETATSTTSSSTSNINASSSNIYKRKSNDIPTSEYEGINTYEQKIRRNAEKISKTRKAKKVTTTISTFFQQDHNDGLSDFESPNKRIQIKTPPVIKKKAIPRKRKNLNTQKAIKNNVLATEVFERVLVHHSSVDGINSDDLQMALALSRSLKETHSSSDESSSNIVNVIRNADSNSKRDIVRKTLQQFGFKKRDNNDYDIKDFFASTIAIRKKKWGSKFTALTRRKDNMQREKLKKNVKNILQICEAYKKFNGELNSPYIVTSPYLQQFANPGNRIYNKSSSLHETEIQDFYTIDLVPISTLRCGSMLKNWAKIPGRDISPQRALNRSNVGDANEPLPVDTFEIKQQESIYIGNDDYNNIEDINVHMYSSDIILTKARDTEDTNNEKLTDNASVVSAEVDERKASPQSPDMFADFSTSANNSFNDKCSANYSDNLSPTSHCSSSVSSPNGESCSDKKPIPNSLKCGIDLSSSTDEDLELDQLSNAQNEINAECKVKMTDILDRKIESFQPTVNNIIVLSSDDEGSCNKLSHYESTVVVDNSMKIDLETTQKMSKHLSFTERLELYSKELALDDDNSDCQLSQLSQSSQDSIIISDDEINYSLNHNEVQRVITDKQDSIELTDSDDEDIIRKSQDSNDYIEDEFQSINNSGNEIDYILNANEVQGTTPDKPNVQSQDSIELTDRKNVLISSPLTDPGINYSLNRNKVQGTKFNRQSIDSQASIILTDGDDVVMKSQLSQNQNKSFESIIDGDCNDCASQRSMNMPLIDTGINYSLNRNKVQRTKFNRQSIESQASILLTDGDDVVMKSQLSQNQNQSFESIIDGDGNDFASQRSMNMHFDEDEAFHSSQRDEDLVNQSVKKICQKEFVMGSMKLSAARKFSRTTSEMTFGKRENTMRNSRKTPERSINISDDEFDEYDKLVKGRSFSSKVSDDIAGDLVPVVSPPQSHEFIVQSMDQIYEVRTGISVSPKPDYEGMDSPTRLEHLKKYGLKSLSKRKAVICLEHIYNRLHPYIELNKDDDVHEIFSQTKLHSVDYGKQVTSQKKKLSNNLLNQQNYNESNENIVAEHFDKLQENDGVFLPSAPRAKKQWCLQPLHIAWHNLIYSNPTLYKHILQYKPIDLSQIRLMFKSIDLHYQISDIIAFLDQKCITFKMDNSRTKTT